MQKRGDPPWKVGKVGKGTHNAIKVTNVTLRGHSDPTLESGESGESARYTQSYQSYQSYFEGGGTATPPWKVGKVGKVKWGNVHTKLPKLPKLL